MRILVIEDEAVLREEVIEWLTMEHYEAAEARDGVDGVAEAIRHPPDLILCDIAMPRLDGLGVLEKLREIPSTAAIPFIFVTAMAADEDILKGIESGACDYITKPFRRLDLLQAIRKQLGTT
jgi:two-component system, sensor histidine kinase and response regulator